MAEPTEITIPLHDDFTATLLPQGVKLTMRQEGLDGAVLMLASITLDRTGMIRLRDFLTGALPRIQG